MLGADARGQLFSEEQRRSAVQYLTSLLHTLVLQTATSAGSIQESLFAQLLRESSVTRQVARKRDRF
jgi:hypothetical protein